MFEIKNLCVSALNHSVQGDAGENEIIKGVSLKIKPGEIHVLMGPNGSGKSTLANALMSHPKVKIVSGNIILDGKEITNLSPDKKAKAGLFLSMQNSPEIRGVSVANFLRVATGALGIKNPNPFAFHEELKGKMNTLGIDSAFAARSLNAGFSGGEKKRMEILQLMTLTPSYAVLDETDSGLDADGLKMAGGKMSEFAKMKKGLLVITHSPRLLDYLKPDFVHVMVDGRIVESGGVEVARRIENEGYNQWQ